MARTPELVPIRLQTLLLLLSYKWACVNGRVGDLGVLCYDDFVSRIDLQSQLSITPLQLADLVHHLKEAVFEQEKPAALEFTAQNYNSIMHRLRAEAPDLFKELPSGEIVMHELEDRVVFGEGNNP